MNRALTHRLTRLEAALIPATPNILTITAIASATGEIISEGHLVMYEPRNHNRRTRMWAGRYEAIELRADRR